MDVGILEAILAVAIEADLVDPSRRPLLHRGLPKAISWDLPLLPRPADQTRSDLELLAARADGCQDIWLENAIFLTVEPSQQRVLRAFLTRQPPTSKAGPSALTSGPHPFDVFLGHASEDKPAVRRLARRLEAAGFTVWLDEEQLGPGQRPPEAIPSGLRAARHLLLWITDAWLNKNYTLWELKCFHEAASADRRVIPVLHLPWDTERLGPYLSPRVQRSGCV